MRMDFKGGYEQDSELHDIEGLHAMGVSYFEHSTFDNATYHFAGIVRDSQLSVKHYVSGLLMEDGLFFLKGPFDTQNIKYPFFYMLGVNQTFRPGGVDFEAKGEFQFNGIWMPATNHEGVDISKLGLDELEYAIKRYCEDIIKFNENNFIEDNSITWYEHLKLEEAILPAVTRINIK